MSSSPTPKTTRSRPPPPSSSHKSFVLHKLGFTRNASNTAKLIGRDAYALDVTAPVLDGIKRLEILMQGARRFARDPALKQRVCILIHRAPKGLDERGWTKFIESHSKRVEKQAALSTNPMSHACFKSAVASPILSGSVRIGTFWAYITCVDVDPRAQFISPPRMRLGHVEYAAIEQAIVMNWIAGIEHTAIGPITLNRSTLHATILDFSGIIMMPKWKHDMVRGGNYVKVLGASVADETADARFLRKLYGALPPASDPAGRAALVEKARQGVWKCAQSIS